MKKRSSTRVLSVVVFGIFAGSGCGGGASGPQATFTVSDGAQTLEAVPWPSDLLRDDDGLLAITTLPLEETPVRPRLIEDLNTEQDGFGVFSGAYFPIGRYAAGMFGGAAVDGDAG